jgi:hypothetical protein
MDQAAMQNMLMSVGYMVLFAIILRSPERNSFIIFASAVAFAIVYNAFYSTFTHHRIITSMALIIRLAVPLDALWRTAGKRREDRVALMFLGLSLLAGACHPGLKAWGYLEIRTLLTGSVALVCLMTCVEHYRRPFPTRQTYVTHLHLQTVWMTAHVVISAAGPWCLETWERWLLLRWAFIAVSIAVIHQYGFLFRRSNRVVRAGVSAVGQPPFVRRATEQRAPRKGRQFRP